MDEYTLKKPNFQTLIDSAEFCAPVSAASLSHGQDCTALWLRYSLTKKISAALRRQFLLHYPDPKHLAQLIGAKQPTLATADAVFNKSALQALQQQQSAEVRDRMQHALDWANQHSEHHIIGLSHPSYPARLLATKNAPPVLYVNGNLSCLRRSRPSGSAARQGRNYCRIGHWC